MPEIDRVIAHMTTPGNDYSSPAPGYGAANGPYVLWAYPTIANKFRLYGSPMNSIIMWIMASAASGHTATNTRLALRNSQIQVFNSKTRAWRRLVVGRPDGLMRYNNTLLVSTPSNADARGNKRYEGADVTSIILWDNTVSYELWTPGGYDAGLGRHSAVMRIDDWRDIVAVYTGVEARTILSNPSGTDDRANARYNVQAGFDMYTLERHGSGSINFDRDQADGGGSRFVAINGNDWTKVHFVTISAAHKFGLPPPEGNWGGTNNWINPPYTWTEAQLRAAPPLYLEAGGDGDNTGGNTGGTGTGNTGGNTGGGTNTGGSTNATTGVPLKDGGYLSTDTAYRQLYGPGRVVADQLFPLPARRVSGADTSVSFRFRAESNGATQNLKLVLASAGNGGTGGTIRVRIFPNDGTNNHLPSEGATPLAAGVHTLAFSGGTAPSAAACTPTITLASAADLVAGTLYHVVIDNTASDPATNWFNVQCLTTMNDNGPPNRWLSRTADWATLRGARTAGSAGSFSWTDCTRAAYSGMIFFPNLQLKTTSNKVYGYILVDTGNRPANHYVIDSDNLLAEQFTLDADVSVVQISIRAACVTAGHLRYAIWNGTSDVESSEIHEPTVTYGTISSDTGAIGRMQWYEIPLTAPRTLRNFYLRLSASGDGAVWRVAVQANGGDINFENPAAFVRSQAKRALAADFNFVDADIYNHTAATGARTNLPIVLHLATSAANETPTGGTSGGGGTSTPGTDGMVLLPRTGGYNLGSAALDRLIGPGVYRLDGLWEVPSKRMGTTEYMAGYRFRAPKSGRIAFLQVYWADSAPGYLSGNGGTHAIELFPVISETDPRPNMQVAPLATASRNNPALGVGSNRYSNGDDRFKRVAISSTQSVVGGQVYMFTLRNTSADPVANFATWDAAYTMAENGFPSPWVNPIDWSACLLTRPQGSTANPSMEDWGRTGIVRGSPAATVAYGIPIMQIFYEDGTSFGFGAMESGNIDTAGRMYKVASPQFVEERIQITEAMRIGGVSIFTATPSNNATLQVTVEAGGTVRASATVTVSAADYYARNNPSIGNNHGVFKRYHLAFTTPVDLPVGTVTLKCRPTSGTWHFPSQRRGDDIAGSFSFSWPAAYTRSQGWYYNGSTFTAAVHWAAVGTAPTNFPFVMHRVLANAPTVPSGVVTFENGNTVVGTFGVTSTGGATAQVGLYRTGETTPISTVTPAVVSGTAVAKFLNTPGGSYYLRAEAKDSSGSGFRTTDSFVIPSLRLGGLVPSTYVVNAMVLSYTSLTATVGSPVVQVTAKDSRGVALPVTWSSSDSASVKVTPLSGQAGVATIEFLKETSSAVITATYNDATTGVLTGTINVVVTAGAVGSGKSTRNMLNEGLN